MFSLIALLVLAPFLLMISIILFISNNGKPFFIHARAGHNARSFKFYKFKTMNDKKDSSGKLLPDKDRLTGFGKVIRSLSLDELPQLVNILKGDMSLIGPRPLPVKYLDRYNEEQKKRHDVKPGITGWAQVNGRNTISWEKKFEYDIYYVENYSFSFDLKILICTIKKVILREGINESADQPMKEFIGTK